MGEGGHGTSATNHVSPATFKFNITFQDSKTPSLRCRTCGGRVLLVPASSAPTGLRTLTYKPPIPTPNTNVNARSFSCNDLLLSES